MKNSLENQRGVTLVELLAVLLLLSLISLVIFGVYISGQKQYDVQKEKTVNQQNIQYVMKYLTKEVRRENEFIVNDDNSLEIGEDTYKWANKTILKNDVVFAENIEYFYVSRITVKILKIELKSASKFKRADIKAETIISIR